MAHNCEQNAAAGRLCCLICDKIRPTDNSRTGLEIWTNETRTVWICESCRHSEPDRTRNLLLNGESKKLGPVIATSCVRRHSLRSDGDAESLVDSNCACQACLERKHLEQEQIREVQDLQKCWVQLRHAIRQMYRDRLLREGITGKGKKFDVAKLKDLVYKLSARDPHQLYQRLESQAREHVMELKVQLLQILVSPEKSGVIVSTKSSEKEKISSCQIDADVAKHFLRSLLGYAGQFFDTVDNMRCCLEKLEKEHLEKFGITWRIVNCNLFDTIVYQDALVQASLPEIYKQLGFSSLGADTEDVDRESDLRPLPLDVAEMMKNLIELDSTMAACRDQMDKAQERMEDYLSQQMKIYKATLKAKQKMLKEDLEFFKQQRKLLEEYVSKKKESKKTSSTDEELSQFTEALRNLLTSNRQSREHSASKSECARCHQRHCPCDECTISHLITCGLITENDLEIELPDSLQFFEDLNESSNESGTDSDDSELGSIDGFSEENNKYSGVDIICRKRTSIICSDGQKVTKVETTILPSSAYSTTSTCSSSTSTAKRNSSQSSSVQQHMYNAYGDWEVSADPSSWLFAGRWDQLVSMKCIKQHCLKRSDPDGQIDQIHKNNSQDDKGEKNVVECKGDSNDANKVNGKREEGDKKVQQCLKAKANVKEAKSSTNPESPISKVPPELLKIMKDEKLAKALAQAAAKRGSSKTVEPYWKDLNLDVETIRRICTQHNDNKQTGVDQNQAPNKQPKDNAGDPGGDDDDDSWSDRSSISQKDGKHCDCCYCEMFGQGNNRIGRDDFPQIRERLRLKLKKKIENVERTVDKKGCEAIVHEFTEAQVQKSEQIQGYRGYESVDHLIEYIEGSNGNQGKNQASSKSAKRQRQKLKKSGTKSGKRNSDETKMNVLLTGPISEAVNDFNISNGYAAQENGPIVGVKEVEESVKAEITTNRSLEESGEQRKTSKCVDVVEVVEYANEEKKVHKMVKCSSQVQATSPKKQAKKKVGGEALNIDEVFQPKDIDLNSCDLDEADKEVEIFKRFVMNCQPQPKREKVQLNIGNLMRNRKATVET